MIKKVAGTFLSKVWVLASSVILLSLVSKNLGGAEALGISALITLAVAICTLLINLGCGPATVYLASRTSKKSLLIPAYLWNIFAVVLLGFLFRLFPVLYPEGFFYDILIISFLQGIFMANKSLLMGREKFTSLNFFLSLQSLGTVLFLLFFIHWYPQLGLKSFSYSMLGGTAIVAIFTLYPVIKTEDVERTLPKREILRQIFSYNGHAQLAQIAQLGNYRLSYFLLETYAGNYALGIFSTATRLSEGIWIVGRSMATVNYARTSNIRENVIQQANTIFFLKISVIISFLIWLLLIAVPESFFTLIFTEEVEGIKRVMMWLGPGIVFMAATFILASYFSGIGEIKINFIGSFVGLVVIGITGYLLIPQYGFTGAAIASSASYLANAAVLFVIFLKKTRVDLKEFFPKRSDIRAVGQMLKNVDDINPALPDQPLREDEKP